MHGKPNKLRVKEPSMRELMEWNFDDYINDYTKLTFKKKQLKNRIRKTGNQYSINSFRR